MQSVSSDFYVMGYAKDPDLEIPYNLDPRFKKTWSCINMNTNEACTFSNGTLL